MSAPRPLPEWRPRRDLLAAARLARQGHYRVSVVLMRQPGVVAEARAVADDLGIEAAIELGANAIVVRFAAPPDHPTD